MEEASSFDGRNRHINHVAYRTWCPVEDFHERQVGFMEERSVEAF